jgi:hypothetical protein
LGDLFVTRSAGDTSKQLEVKPGEFLIVGERSDLGDAGKRRISPARR